MYNVIIESPNLFSIAGDGSWMPVPHLLNYSQIEYEPEGGPVGHAQNIWLFNIHRDPSEFNDLSATHINIVKKLLDKLERYQATAVSIHHPGPDFNHPVVKGAANVWEPWLD